LTVIAEEHGSEVLNAYTFSFDEVRNILVSAVEKANLVERFVRLFSKFARL
jgi:hypothetical protein